MSRSSSSAVLPILWDDCNWEGRIRSPLSAILHSRQRTGLICNENFLLAPICAICALNMIQIPDVPLHHPTVSLIRHKCADSEPGWDFGAVTRTFAQLS